MLHSRLPFCSNSAHSFVGSWLHNLLRRTYSCFEKNCLTKGEKLALQCRKLLWVSEPEGVPALSKETAQTRFHVFFFLLALTLRTSSKQLQTITTQNINRYCHVPATTCVEIAVKNFFKNYIQVSCFDVEFITLVLIANQIKRVS